MRLSEALRVAGLAAFCSTAAIAQQDTDPGTSYLFEVPRPVPPALHAVLHMQFDVLHAHSGAAPTDQPLRVVVMPEELSRFQAVVKNNAVLIERGRPFSEVVAERRAAAGVSPDMPDPNYYTTAEVEAEIDMLVSTYPTLCQKIDLTTLPGAARTHDNNSIWALKISDNVTTEEDEPAMLIAAQHHSREMNAPHMVIGAMQRVANGYATTPSLRAVVDEFELYFVPTVNPDGVDYVWCCDQWWRKNRRRNSASSYGVDLNRNFASNWGQCGASTNPNSQTYRGPSPDSEPETRTMIAAVRALRPEVYIDFHSSGREVLFTYPPCANYTSTITNFLNRYINDLRTPMSYATRSPSASGEAPEDHWIRSGALSFLIEISTSFQPAFSSTIAEENRVWPGLKRVMENWRPAVRGHVRSIFQNEPVEASVTYTPNVFQEGERAVSRARDGRYGLWLPIGNWQVTWSAPGFQSVTRPVQVTSYDSPQTIEIEMVPNWATAVLVQNGSNRLGTTTTLSYTSPGDSGNVFWIPLSFGTTPGIPNGQSRTIPLNADSLFVSSLSAAPILTNNLGTLNVFGQATAQFNIPNLVPLVGATLYTAGLTFESGYPDEVKKWSTSTSITITP